MLNREIKPIIMVYVLSGIAYLGFAIELFGALNQNNQTRNPILQVPHIPDWIGVFAVLLTVVAPVPALFAFAFAAKAIRRLETKVSKALLWTFVTAAGFLSIAESLWSCSGHPTWIGGY